VTPQSAYVALRRRTGRRKWGQERAFGSPPCPCGLPLPEALHAFFTFAEGDLCASWASGKAWRVVGGVVKEVRALRRTAFLRERKT